MRKILFILFLFSSTLILAQSFDAGLQLGMTGTQVTGDQLSGFHKAGLFGGVFVSHPAGKIGDFQLELNFIQKGSRKNARPDEGDYLQYIMRLNYVAMPLMYRFKIKELFIIEVGVEFAYLISAKEFDEYGQITPDPNKSSFRDIDFSGFAGLGINMGERFRFVFRYSYSIIPIRPLPPSGYYFYDSGQFNEVLIGSIQYNF